MKNSFNLVGQIFHALKKLHITSLSLIPSILAIVLSALWITAGKWIYTPVWINNIVFTFLGILMGCTGLIYIWKKEMPGPIAGKVIRGTVPIVTGIVIFVFITFLSLLYLYLSYNP